MEKMSKTNALEHLPMSECLQLILEDNEWSGVVLYYLLNKRLKSPLYAIYRKYAQLLVDQFDDLVGNFFIYLRDGGKEKNGTHHNVYADAPYQQAFHAPVEGNRSKARDVCSHGSRKGVPNQKVNG